jgi:hypothetical protein
LAEIVITFNLGVFLGGSVHTTDHATFLEEKLPLFDARKREPGVAL